MTGFPLIIQNLKAYVLDRKKMPRNFPGHYGCGDENEAVIYAHENGAAWKATPGVLEWLAARVKQAKHIPSTLSLIYISSTATFYTFRSVKPRESSKKGLKIKPNFVYWISVWSDPILKAGKISITVSYAGVHSK